MIVTECWWCDEPITHPYNAGDRGAGGFAVVECPKCGKNNYIELVSIDGETMSEEYFFQTHPDAKVM